MNDALSWLFGLDRLRFGEEAVTLEWARPLPAWAWVLLAAALAAGAGWTYWRLIAPRFPRALLAGARTLLLLTLLALIAGPQLVRRNERVERDWVVVLADRSRSMTIPDAPGDGGAREARERQLIEAVRAARPALDELAREREVLWLGFDAGAYELRTTDAGVDLGEPDGRSTFLGRAIEQSLRRLAAKPVAGLVVLSDGRSSDALPKGAERRLEGERIPVFVVPLGSASPIPDLAVARVEAPRLAFVGDIVPVNVRVERSGGGEQDGAQGPSNEEDDRVEVELYDRATGLVLDRADGRLGPDGGADITLTSRPDAPGEGDWGVRLVRRPGQGPDLIPANDERAARLELVDRPLRVVYIDGYPRWEHRYLKNLLLREKSVLSSSLLLATDRRYLQEGDIILDRLPTSPEEWAEIDVVVLGDVRPDVFGEAQLRQLRAHIAERGAGLVWIGGPGHTPGAWAQTPLADLLPFTSGSGAAGLAPTAREPVTMAPTPLADRLGLLRLGEAERDAAGGRGGRWPERLTDPRTGWSILRWSQRIEPDRLKPASEVLAVALEPNRGGPGARASADDTALVITMRYGAGRVLYIATDEIWRWRYARGEALPERFWIPLIRYIGRESLGRSGQEATLEITPRQAMVDQPVRVGVRLLDQALVDAAPTRLRVRLAPRDPDAGGPVDLTLTREPTRSPSEGSLGAGVASYASTWLPDRPGVYTAEASDPLLAGLGLSGEVVVAARDDELRRPETDHEALARLASDTGGRVLGPDDLPGLSELLPNRQRRVESAPDIETLWDTPIALIWLMTLLTLEWVGRRLIRLA